jgi:CheY-like chemotaxis protein
MKKVLIVEDHNDMHEVLIWQVELMGFEAISARDGNEGLEKALVEKPDLILMDIMMPNQNGLDATRMLRARAETKEIPILAETALFSPSDLRKIMEAGCSGFIVKPFTFHELQIKIRELIPADEVNT